MSENLLPRQGLDLWEPVLGVLRVHGEDLLSARCAQDFDDFDELVDAALSREDGLAEHQLSNDAAHGPDIDVGAIVGISEDELRGAVVARADVGNVWLALDQLLCAAKVAQFEDVGASID